MRKLFIYMVVCLLSVVQTGCEVIDWNDRLIPVDTHTTGQRTHVLLEFTGFRCVNCPNASEIAQNLDSMYQGSLIVVALHPASNPFTQGKYDYTCPAADSVYQFLGGDVYTTFPTGNLNMQVYEGNRFVNMNEWATMVHQAMSDTAAPNLFFTAELDPEEQKTISSTINYPAIEANLALWLVEDSVTGVQAMPDGSINMTYLHRHMLRAVAGDKPFGVPTTGQMMTLQVTVPEGCNHNHLRLVALLIDPKDKHIIQAYEKKPSLGGYMPPL